MNSSVKHFLGVCIEKSNWNQGASRKWSSVGTLLQDIMFEEAIVIFSDTAGLGNKRGQNDLQWYLLTVV